MALKIATPPWTKLGKKLESCTRKALYEFNLLDGVKRVAIALSGGKDSLTLLFLLNAIRGKGFPNFDIIAIHVSGEFSCGASIQERFLQKICTELSIPLKVCISNRKREELECYSCSRERRKLIFNSAKEARADVIAFGHHRDDSIQTLLMNLLHKAEFAANLPKVLMKDYGVTIIRPLIFITEDEIIRFAQMYNFARITCQCPVGQNSQRKKTKELIKQLEELYPNTRRNLALASLNYGSNKALV